MIPKHWSARYFRDLIQLLWDETLHLRDPWLTRGAITFLDRYLRPGFRGLEWGSGRSTLWFAGRTSFLVSIETEPGWYRKTKKMLSFRRMRQVEQVFEPDPAAAVLVADRFEAESLDYILVDGRPSRSACCLLAIEKLRPGGVLVLDNANRYLPCDSLAPDSRSKESGPLSEEFGEFLRRVKDWETNWTSNGVWDTAIFRKPGG